MTLNLSLLDYLLMFWVGLELALNIYHGYQHTKTKLILAELYAAMEDLPPEQVTPDRFHAMEQAYTLLDRHR